ncbi:MAG TPA: LuxR C-terminal-related transcriptional regulator [Steroidobacteraceae bacterium]|nr:LuxR C-terminal-related transcriptional regulator [Steroidobacteraceae bacterium]
MIERTTFQRHTAPPAFRVALAERSRLVDDLRSATDRRLILVDAPAGYGKTWLLGRLHATLRSEGSRVVWLGVEAMDATQFLALTVAGLERAGLDVGRWAGCAAEDLADVPVAAVVSGVIAALENATPRLVVFVDDVHRLSRDGAQSVLARLIAEAPPNVHFVCSGRESGAVPRADLRARGELVEVGAERLRFSPDEARKLLPQLDAGQIEQLLERTEGWPVALQLARLWIEARPERCALLHTFSGRTSEVAEYLTEQVLADLPPHVQRVLADVSIVDTLNPELVRTLSDRPDAWRLLLEEGRLEHFLVPLDEERYWFRLHHLLLDYLRARLREQEADLSALHARAASWFEQDGDLLKAVTHLVQAGDIERAVRLIERAGGWEMVLFGGAVRMRALLGALPEDRLAEFPRALICRAYVAAKDGEVARGLRIYESAGAALRDSDDPALRRDAMVVGHLLGRYADRPVAASDLEALYREIEALPQSDDAARAALLNTACLVALATGDMPATREACTRAIREMRRIGSVLGLNYCVMHLGLAQLHSGERREAEATWREAVAMAEENFGADSGLKANADIHLALALHARGEVAAAADRLQRSLSLVESRDGWLDLFAEGYEVAIANAVARRAPEEAAQVIVRMRRNASQRGLLGLERQSSALATRLSLALRIRGPAAAHLVPRLAVPECFWEKGVWRDSPWMWREHHQTGVNEILNALASTRPQLALDILDDLEAAAHAGDRRRHLRLLAALRGAARLAIGTEPADTVLEEFISALDSAVAEDDTQFLVDLGPPILPLLQSAWAWSRDHWPSSRGRHALTSAVTSLARACEASDVPDGLSARELEVLVELASGAPNKVIARNLQMTENTVKFHLKNVYQKLKVRHRAQALQAARARGLLS